MYKYPFSPCSGKGATPSWRNHYLLSTIITMGILYLPIIVVVSIKGLWWFPRNTLPWEFEPGLLQDTEWLWMNLLIIFPIVFFFFWFPQRIYQTVNEIFVCLNDSKNKVVLESQIKSGASLEKRFSDKVAWLLCLVLGLGIGFFVSEINRLSLYGGWQISKAVVYSQIPLLCAVSTMLVLNIYRIIISLKALRNIATQHPLTTIFLEQGNLDAIVSLRKLSLGFSYFASSSCLFIAMVFSFFSMSFLWSAIIFFSTYLVLSPGVSFSPLLSICVATKTDLMLIKRFYKIGDLLTILVILLLPMAIIFGIVFF